jgi:hypothetical protein
MDSNKIDINKCLEKNKLLLLLQILTVVTALICIFGQSIIDLHFIYKHTVQIAIVFWVLGLLSLIFRKTKLMFTLFFACFFICLFLKEKTKTPLDIITTSMKQSFKTAHYDLSLTNEPDSIIIADLIKNDADFLMIQEVNPTIVRLLESTMDKKYINKVSIHKLDLTKTYFYSKYKITECDSSKIQYNSTITLTSSLNDIPENRLRFSLSYSMPPFNNKSIMLLDTQLYTISTKIKEDRNVIVAGNFNLESFSPKLEIFKSKNSLFDCGTGYRTTSNNTSFSVFDVPYNHIYYKGGLQCTSFEPVIDNSNICYGDKCIFQYK